MIHELQWVQLKHDEFYHRDIMLLPVGDRVKHMALHMAKYVGAALDAMEAAETDRFERILVDAFVINLATANTLNLDLREIVRNGCDADESLMALGATLASELHRPSDDKNWFVHQMARHTGRLAKACESLDHVEAYPFREAMRECVVALTKLVIVESAQRQLDLPAAVSRRLAEVERKSIFDSTHKAGIATS